MAGRWITVANRLPFSLKENAAHDIAHDGMRYKVSTASGGLVSALNGVHANVERLWIGAAPDHLTEENWPEIKKHIAKSSDGWSYAPVFLEPSLYDRYYNRLCNDVLWPLLHYQPELVQFDVDAWDAYREVNQRIANEIAEQAKDDDLIWVHDFHFFLVPKMLRKLRPKLRIGFFLHVPFPSSEVFRQLPVREEILDSLLDCDLVGFHDYAYLQHFGSCLLRLLGVESNFLSASRAGRTTRLGVFPVSIDTDVFIKKAKEPGVTKLVKDMQKPLFMFLGVDRLDYIKGLDLKLQAFRQFLRSYPEVREKVALLQVAVPTRTGVPVYAKLARDIARLVGEINGEFSTPNWTPVQYIHASVTSEQLLALYRLADALLVTSKRDGMNLVALEYIAAQNTEHPGVVLLSEFTGAISTLSHTLPINPWDLQDSARKMQMAMQMPKNEKAYRLKTMQDFLKGYNSTHWATAFIDELSSCDPIDRAAKGPPVIEPDHTAISILCDRILASRPDRLALFVDYDGTLTPIRSRPEEAVLSKDEKDAIRHLSRYRWLDLVIVSGRDSHFLSEQFDGIRVHMAAEHGAKTFDPGVGRWRKRVLRNRASWYPSAVKIISDYTARVPHSMIEKKQYSVAWHYRLAPREYADFQARKLAEELEMGLANMPVNILRGKKVIEARAIEADKGVFARTFLENGSPQTFGLAIGDDQTDEDMFQALRGRGLSFKVGSGSSRADVALSSQSEVIPFLLALVHAIDARLSGIQAEARTEMALH